MPAQAILGTQLGGWLVVSEAQKRGAHRYYNCVCKCGAAKAVRGTVLNKGVGTCGSCAQRGVAVTHGMTHTFEFGVWTAMRKRCNYAKHPAYHRYGGRGITICPAWAEFAAFFADMGPCPFGSAGSLDRVDNALGYGPSNCRWVLRSQQAKHRDIVRVFNGQTLPELAESLGVKYTTLRRRINAGWPESRWGLTPEAAGTRRS